MAPLEITIKIPGIEEIMAKLEGLDVAIAAVAQKLDELANAVLVETNQINEKLAAAGVPVNVSNEVAALGAIAQGLSKLTQQVAGIVPENESTDLTPIVDEPEPEEESEVVE